MPIDPVYNPQLPSASLWRPRSSVGRLEAPTSTALSMPDDRGSSWSAMSAGLLAGLFAGATLALLVAPVRGNEVRRSIRRYVSDSGHRVTRMLDSGRSIAGDAAHRASSLVEQGRRAFRTRSRTIGSDPVTSSSAPTASGVTHGGSQPLTASVAEMTRTDRRFEEPLGG